MEPLKEAKQIAFSKRSLVSISLFKNPATPLQFKTTSNSNRTLCRRVIEYQSWKKHEQPLKRNIILLKQLGYNVSQGNHQQPTHNILFCS